MKFTADDDRFGIVVTPQGDHHLYRFQLIVGGRLIGESEGCIVGSAMKLLGDLKCLDDQRLDILSEDPAAVSSVLLSDDEFHTASTFSVVESLDDWLVQAYIRDGKVVFLAQEYVNDEPGGLRGPILVSIVDALEYDAMFDAVWHYWYRHASSDQNRSEPSRS